MWYINLNYEIVNRWLGVLDVRRKSFRTMDYFHRAACCSKKCARYICNHKLALLIEREN